MEKVVFHAYAWGSYLPLLDRLEKTAKHFHPEIPFVAYRNKDVDRIKQKYPFLKWFTMMSPFGLELSEQYDLVVHIDADSLITGRMTELLEGDYEIAGVRNQNDLGKAGAHPPITKNLASLYEFINAGLVASRSKEFWKDWFEINKNSVPNIYNDENDTLNVIFHNKKYKTKILDAKDITNVFYGIANAYGEHSHWESWKKICVINDQLFLDGKVVKVLHQAGGPNSNKMDINNLFNSDVAQFIQSIIV